MFFIPRNYSDASRIFGMFESKYLLHAAIWAIPTTGLVLIIPFIPLEVKAIMWGVVTGVPCMVCLTGTVEKLKHMLYFKKTACIHYSESE